MSHQVTTDVHVGLVNTEVKWGVSTESQYGVSTESQYGVSTESQSLSVCCKYGADNGSTEYLRILARSA